MGEKLGRWALVAILPLALGLVAGCASAPLYRVHPQYEERLRAIKTVALVPPDVKVYQHGIGKDEFMDDWSETARKNLASSIAKRVSAEGRFVLKAFDPNQSPASEQEIQNGQTLFKAVALSALGPIYKWEETYGQMSPKKEQFEYSLGPFPFITAAVEADALLFVYAEDHISSGAQKALNVFWTIFAIGSALGGQPCTSCVEFGPTVLIMSLVDSRTADLLWFNWRRDVDGGYDLRDPASTEGLVGKVLAELKEEARK